jgi:hypothetical protein
MVLDEPYRVVAEALGESRIADRLALKRGVAGALVVDGADLNRVACRLVHRSSSLSPCF